MLIHTNNVFAGVLNNYTQHSSNSSSYHIKVQRPPSSLSLPSPSVSQSVSPLLCFGYFSSLSPLPLVARLASPPLSLVTNATFLQRWQILLSVVGSAKWCEKQQKVVVRAVVVRTGIG